MHDKTGSSVGTGSGTEPKPGAVGSQGSTRVNRRTALRAASGLLAVLGIGRATAADDDSDTESDRGDSHAGGDKGTREGRQLHQRLAHEFRTRLHCARTQLREQADASPHPSNDRLSRERVVSKYGKALAHDDGTGLPTAAAYRSLVTACERGEGFDEIEQARADSRPQAQPEAGWNYLPVGASQAQLRIAAPPAFDSAETGAELIEDYWRALTRDVPFREYDTHPLVQAAADELDGLDAYNGPGSGQGERVTPENVFRGVTPGCERGPFVSQFLYKHRNLPSGRRDQRTEIPVARRTPSDYMTSVEDWLKIQKGVAPPADSGLPENEFDGKRYAITGRDLAERVRAPPVRQPREAADVLLTNMNVPLDDGLPYTLAPGDAGGGPRGENFLGQPTGPVVEFGPPSIRQKLFEAAAIGLKAAWHKKWNVHRRLRPEEYGGRIDATLRAESPLDGDYPIPENLRRSAAGQGTALARTRQAFGTYLLPQAYAEGSPTHPSYPAGHSTVAGACVTVLKALFDGDYVFPDSEKVVPTADGSELLTATETSAMNIDDRLTVRGELNKLAANEALARDRAGVHYRSDGIEGLRLGEAAAIRYLEDQLSLPVGVRERAGGPVTLDLETFDGEKITIRPTIER